MRKNASADAAHVSTLMVTNEFFHSEHPQL
jgi:hypothetical protein